jgi:hypothetical protein
VACAVCAASLEDGTSGIVCCQNWGGSKAAIMPESRRFPMAPRRGNPNSTRVRAVDTPAFSASSFERVVDSLKLLPEQYQSSTELREWVLRNKDHKYVPPELLKAFGFQVNLEP